MDTLLLRIDTEAGNLLRIFFGLDGLVLIVLVALIWLGAAALRKTLRLRTGVLADSPIAVPTVNAVGLVLTVALFVRYLYRGAPLLIAFVLLVASAAMVFALGVRARAWLSGVGQILLARLQPGDRVSFEEASGFVARIGLFRLILRTDGGDRLHVPVAALDGRTFSVSSPERAFPVAYIAHLAAPADADSLALVRRHAALCPYRDTKSAVFVEVDSTDPTRVHVRFRAWSQSAAGRAEGYLRTRIG